MQGGEKILESSTRFGFQNYTGFYRAFRREYGCAPVVYLQEQMSSAASEEQYSE